jgi:hypothetical protein
VGASDAGPQEQITGQDRDLTKSAITRDSRLAHSAHAMRLQVASAREQLVKLAD